MSHLLARTLYLSLTLGAALSLTACHRCARRQARPGHVGRSAPARQRAAYRGHVRGDAVSNGIRAGLFDYQLRLEELERAPDRGEWWLEPQTVNAVNLPIQNALNFPAAILEPPFYDPQASTAARYGAIGATIGHEISHSFDNQGSQFDATGRLANWWTPEDTAHFKGASYLSPGDRVRVW